MLNTVPSALVSRLLLAPKDIFGLIVTIDLSLKILVWKRIQLLNADNHDIRNFVRFSVSQQIVIDSATTGDNAPHFLWVKIFYFRDYRLKASVG